MVPSAHEATPPPFLTSPRAARSAVTPSAGARRGPSPPPMNRRRRCADGNGAKRRRRDGSPGAVEAALGALGALFPTGPLWAPPPPLVLRHQIYSIVSDRTAVDRHLDRLRADGRIRLLHVGLGADTLGVVCMDAYRENDTLGVVCMDAYREKVLAGAAGSPRAPLIRRFLDGAVAASAALGYGERELREWGFGDRDVTQLVAAGLLTVRDAGSWWLSVRLGRFIRAILRASPPPPVRCCDWRSPERPFPSCTGAPRTTRGRGLIVGGVGPTVAPPPP
ncbi:LOW QUALITY PROTEIN: inactive serine/threonine-protein kinase 19-like [Ara ararauna]